VPIDIHLGLQFRILVVTGPNTGGKTVALKTVGLLAVMAQCGLQLPAADGSFSTVFSGVYADIGDEQSIEQSLSTFSSHVTRIIGILQRADARSLVLLDELGAGTDPQEGAAIARALLDYLREHGAYVIATTHYPELKSYAQTTPRVENASVEFDLETLSPTYRLMIGTPGRSNALAIAERLGMPRDVLEAARGHLAPEVREAETLLAEIHRDRAAAEDARRRALKEAAEAATLKHQARNTLRNAERKHEEVWTRAQRDADEELAELRREALRVRQQLQAAATRASRAASAAASSPRLWAAAKAAIPSPRRSSAGATATCVSE
jgi:DNA mismatch repair protein MutS2